MSHAQLLKAKPYFCCSYIPLSLVEAEKDLGASEPIGLGERCIVIKRKNKCMDKSMG
jgi:hypothetical protein